MANPRKFSEKIALHNQKQAEETAAFQQIMKEVMDVRPMGSVLPTPMSSVPQPITQNQTLHQQQQQNHLSISLANYRGHGGSLPNVNQMTQHGDKASHSSRGCYQPSTSPRSQRSSIGPVRIKPNHRETSPYASPPSASMLSSSMSSATPGGFGSTGLPGLMSYAPNSYLSPPMDSSCRRFNSDSALNLNTLLIPATVPDSSEDSSNNSNDYTGAGLSLVFNRGSLHDSMGMGNHVISRSPTGGDPHSLLEIPPVPVSMSSTGSLPDLTNFHFPLPLHPVDVDDHNQHNHSPYSTSPLTGSTYSPTSSHASPQGAGGGGQSQPGTQSQVQISQSPHSPGSHTPRHVHENSPLQVNTSFQNFTNDNMLSAYRSPQRPSPQNSPSPYRSASPSDGQLSGPSSPGQGQTTQVSPNEFYMTQQAQALQQHFEQISVRDGSPRGSDMRFARHWQGTNAGGPYFYTHPNVGAPGSQQSPQHPQPQTPQTPSSIPDIIFTDFSDPRTVAADQLQLEELLQSEQLQAAFRDGLGQIDFDGFQMLDQPDLVQLDPQVEDSFRLDRL